MKIVVMYSTWSNLCFRACALRYTHPLKLATGISTLISLAMTSHWTSNWTSYWTSHQSTSHIHTYYNICISFCIPVKSFIVTTMKKTDLLALQTTGYRNSRSGVIHYVPLATTTILKSIFERTARPKDSSRVQLSWLGRDERKSGVYDPTVVNVASTMHMIESVGVAK